MVDMELLESLNTDISVAPPNEYADAGTPNLLPEGTYDLHVTGFDVILKKDSGDFNGFTITAQVVDGEYAGRSTGRLSIWASTYERNGVRVSQLGDFIRALDATANWDSPATAAKVIQMAIDRKMPFRAKLGWEAFDQTAYEEKGGKALVNKSPEQKLLRKNCTVKGMRMFPLNPDGSYRPEIETAGGELIEARLSINGFISSHKRR